MPHGEHRYGCFLGIFYAKGGLDGVLVEAVDHGRNGGRCDNLAIWPVNLEGGPGHFRVDYLLSKYQNVQGQNHLPDAVGLKTEAKYTIGP